MRSRWTFAATFLVVTYSLAASACSCTTVNEGSRCAALGSEPLFVGTVTEVVDLPRTGGLQFLLTRKARLVVEEVFSGVEPGMVEVFTGSGGGDCGFGFEVGERYLVQGNRDKEGRIRVGICSDSRHVHYAAAILPQLRAIRDKQRVASLYGILSKVQRRFGGEYPDFDTEESVLPNVTVKLRLEADYETVTNQDGVFAFYDLPAGTFSFSADLPSGWELGDYIGNSEPPSPVKLGFQACLERPLAAFPSGSILVRIVDDSGGTPRYVSVTLLSADYPSRDFRGPWNGAEGGKLRIDHLAPGRYLLVANAKGRLSPDSVYPRTFYPGVNDISLAQPIVLAAGEHVEVDFHVRPAAARSGHEAELNPARE